MKWLDIPPVWLALAAFCTWWIAALQPAAMALGGPLTDFIGGLLVGAGLLLILLAAFEMQRQRTTIVPHMEAAKLVTTGIFARSRNPIYLGDTLILAGLALRWDAPVALLLVPVFVTIITRRFIMDEEARLQAKFPVEFAGYCEKTRRWI
ncbi:MAG: isoprenylcysteine carboxylmethyltransferase family protein [Pseudomonadota bacterium]